MQTIDDVTRNSLKQAGDILVSFLPIFAFGVIASGHSLMRFDIGIYIGTVLLIVMALMRRLTSGVILGASAGFFAVALILGVWLESIWFIRYVGAFPSGMLFVAAMLSMILGRPFVQEYARKGVPPEQQESANFVRVCFVMTSFWTALLLVMTLVAVVKISYPGPGKLFYVVVNLGVLVVGLAYTTAYTVHIKHRRLAMENVSGKAA